MSLFPLPTAHFTTTGASISDGATPTPQTANVTIGTTSWAISQGTPPGSVTIGTNQLDSVATGIERLIQQDYSLPSELKSIDIDADGSFPALLLTCIQASDLPVSFTLGGWSPNLGVARSFAALVRSQGIGSEYVP